MRRTIHLSAVAWGLAVLCVGAAGVQAAELPAVSITAADISLPEFLSEVSAQTGVAIYLGEAPDLEVTVDLADADIETAIHAAAVQANCSWVRIYMLEPPDQPPEAEDFGKLVGLVTEARRQYLARMTDEEREAVAAEVAALVQDGGDATEETPIGGWRASARSDNASGAGLDRMAYWALSDPLRFAASPSYSDPASVQCADADLTAFTDALADASGFVVLDRLVGSEEWISVDLTEAPVDDIVAAAAEQLGCSWRRVYLIANVRTLSSDEAEDRINALFDTAMGYFWSQPQADRAEIIRRAVDGSKQLTNEQRAQIRSSDIARKLMQKLINYSNSLPMDQRRELMPLLQQAAKIMSG